MPSDPCLVCGYGLSDCHDRCPECQQGRDRANLPLQEHAPMVLARMRLGSAVLIGWSVGIATAGLGVLALGRLWNWGFKFPEPALTPEQEWAMTVGGVTLGLVPWIAGWWLMCLPFKRGTCAASVLAKACARTSRSCCILASSFALWAISLLAMVVSQSVSIVPAVLSMAAAIAGGWALLYHFLRVGELVIAIDTLAPEQGLKQAFALTLLGACAPLVLSGAIDFGLPTSRLAAHLINAALVVASLAAASLLIRAFGRLHRALTKAIVAANRVASLKQPR
jgi:hypothetical protein